MNAEQFNQFTLEAFVTRREAMLAENRENEKKNEYPAWTGTDFFNLEQDILRFRNER
ncbi:MAG: hypothetical protein M0R66_10380 [Candidatus Omnitrophica bacterium]|jgi:hypothetical protein|nr:hypothetical protein [Candidatus Omnitrophota bacterium]